MIPAIGIVGSQSNIGKTILMEHMIKELKKKNYRIASIKHDIHGFEMDKPGKDTYRYAQAGADTVLISSKDKMAMIKRVDEELTIDSIISSINDVDIILVEGYKNSHLPKIEVIRQDVCCHIHCKKEELIAIVSDAHIEIDDIPIYSMSNINQLITMIEEKINSHL